AGATIPGAVFWKSIGFRRRTLDDPRSDRIDGPGSRPYGITLRALCLPRGRRLRGEAAVGDAISVWRASRKGPGRQVNRSELKMRSVTSRWTRGEDWTRTGNSPSPG